jgi:hypothetical protein
MIRISTWFKFQPPPDWGEINEGGRLVYRSPKGEVLMVSTAAISGQGNAVEIEQVREKLLQNAITTVTNGAKQTDLRITRELQSDDRVFGIECWTVEAETLNGRELYLQSVFRNAMGVLLATFEGFNCPASKVVYDGFVKSVESNG